MAMPPERQKLALIGILACLGFVVACNYLLVPQWTVCARRMAGRRALGQKVARLRRDLQTMDSLKTKQAQLLEQVHLPESSIPPEEQLPDAMDKIARAARSSQVRLLALRPKEEIGKMPVGPSGYLEMPLELTASAGYHAVGRFLDFVESSPDLLRLRELDIRESATEDELWMHSVRMVLTVHLAPRSDDAPGGGA